jgi:hypothetical protein
MARPPVVTDTEIVDFLARYCVGLESKRHAYLPTAGRAVDQATADRRPFGSGCRGGLFRIERVRLTELCGARLCRGRSDSRTRSGRTGPHSQPSQSSRSPSHTY